MRRAYLAAFLLTANLIAQNIRIVRPKEIDDVLINPGIGFTTLNRFNGDPLNEGTKWTEGYPIVAYPFKGKLEVKGQPLTTIAYFRVYWKFVEPEMGKYNWPMLDAALKTAHDRGQALMLRIAPYGLAPDQDVPAWYRQLVGDESAKKLPAKWKTDPENPLYARYWTRLVRELGNRYDGHPDLDSVDVSIVGAWGEGEFTGNLSDRTMKVLVDSYLESFKKTLLMMQPTDRRTNMYALSKRNVGWRADCLGDMRCVDGNNWCHMFDAYPEDIVNFGLQDAWQKGPVSLEACWVMQHWKNQNWDIDYIIDQSLKWHISSFNNKSSAVPEEWWPQVNRWLKKMGYRFVLRKFTYPSVVQPLGKLAFTTWWENKGVAPCYRRYPLALRLKGAARTVVLETDADIRSWLPGDIVYDDAVFIPADIPAGSYQIGLALLDPVTRLPKVKLAIAGMDSEGWYNLGEIRVQP
jgi:hypothetical protein